MLKITKEMAKEVGVTLTGGPRWVAKYYLVIKDRKVGEGEAEVNAWSVKQARLVICCVEKKKSQCGIKFISCRKEEVELSAEAVDAMNHHKHGSGTATKKNIGVRILLTGTNVEVLSDQEFKKGLAGLVKEAMAIGVNGIELVNNSSLGEPFIELGKKMGIGYEKFGLKVWATVAPDGTYGNFFAEVNVGAPTPTPEPPKPENPEQEPEPEKESAPVDILEALAQRVSDAEEREEVIDEEAVDEAAAEEVCDSVPQDSEPVVPFAPVVEEEAIIPKEGDTISENHSVERASSAEFHEAIRSIIQQ